MSNFKGIATLIRQVRVTSTLCSKPTTWLQKLYVLDPCLVPECKSWEEAYLEEGLVKYVFSEKNEKLSGFRLYVPYARCIRTFSEGFSGDGLLLPNILWSKPSETEEILFNHIGYSIKLPSSPEPYHYLDDILL